MSLKDYKLILMINFFFFSNKTGHVENTGFLSNFNTLCFFFKSGNQILCKTQSSLWPKRIRSLLIIETFYKENHILSFVVN